MRLFRKYKNCSDEELMSFIQANDYGAFEELHSRYAKRLLHFMFKMLNNDEERAQDLLQDLFLKLVEAPEKFDATRRFYSWVFTVAANMCRKEYRAPIHDDVSDVELEARMRNLATDRLISAVDGHVVKKHLSKALDGLDNKHRECFVLRHQEDLVLMKSQKFWIYHQERLSRACIMELKNWRLSLRSSSRC